MSEEPAPELEALAARLFAAGRTERPGPALGRRLVLIDPRHTRQHLPAGASIAVTARSAARGASARVLLRSRLARGVALAALVASGAGVWLVSQMNVDAVLISSERVSTRSRSTVPVTAPPVVNSQPVASQPELSPAAPLVAAPPDTPASARVRPRLGAKGAARRASEASPTPDRSSATRALEPAAAPRVAAHETSSVTPSSTGPHALTLLGELALLKQARAALRSGQPRDALELLEAHGRQRGGSALVAEATLLRIEALAALGERTVASELAKSFVRDNPHSALSDRAKSFIFGGAPGAP